MTGEQVRRLGPHQQPSGKVRFAPSGPQLLSGGFDHRIVLWNLNSGNGREFLGHTGNITGMAFTPDGRHVLSSCQDGSAQMWDVSSGRPEHRFAQGNGPVSDIVCTPDGRYAITSDEELKLRIWRIPTEVADGVPDYLAP